MVSKEENEIEMIKDFLKVKGFKATLESLEREEGNKGGDKRNLKVIFYLLNINFLCEF